MNKFFSLSVFISAILFIIFSSEDISISNDKANLKKRFLFKNVHINYSNRQPELSAYYSLETEQVVLELLSTDFELFNYPKRLL